LAKFRLILDADHPDLWGQVRAGGDYLDYMRSKPLGYVMGVTFSDGRSFGLIRRKGCVRVYPNPPSDQGVLPMKELDGGEQGPGDI